MFKNSFLEWQNAIVGLLLMTVVCGVFASALTVLGIMSIHLAKKVYYYHSAGEVYLVCGTYEAIIIYWMILISRYWLRGENIESIIFYTGICSGAAVAVYPAVLELTDDTPIHRYGIGLYLALGTPLCYFVAAFCMALDDVIHSLSNDCCMLCRKKSVRNKAKSNTVWH